MSGVALGHEMVDDIRGVEVCKTPENTVEIVAQLIDLVRRGLGIEHDRGTLARITLVLAATETSLVQHTLGEFSPQFLRARQGFKFRLPRCLGIFATPVVGPKFVEADIRVLLSGAACNLRERTLSGRQEPVGAVADS